MIELEKLTKEFNGRRVVDELSFEVPKGQILGFLGPNGAGKSTTMKMLTCFLEPTSGTARIGGKDVVEDSLAVRQQIGYLPESAPLYAEMTVREFLEFIAEVRGFRQKSDKLAACEKMKAQCYLEDVWDQPIETLSKGYRQRVGFAQSLIHDPPVLILDEPTDGLDPNQKFEVRELIRRMGQNKTIILSTHILEEVEAVCERVIIIAQGRMVCDATPQELLQKSKLHNALTIRFRQSFDDDQLAQLRQLDFIKEVELIDTERLCLRVYPNGQAAEVVQKISIVAQNNQWDFDDMHIERGRLDEVFRTLTLS